MFTTATTCPLGCRAAAGVELAGPGFTLWRCRECGLVRTDPPPDPRTLQRRYDAPDYLDLDTAEAGLLRRCRDRLAVMAPYVSTGPLLDVGAGAGTFLYAAQEQGYGGRGIDLSPRWADHARRRYEATVEVGDIGEIDLPSGAFAVITLWHVLEHLPSPVSVLRRLRTALRPGGRLVVEVPNYAAPTNRLKRRWLLLVRHRGGRWRHLNPWEHPWHFERASLQACLRRAGYEPVLCRTMSGDCNTGGGTPTARFLQARGWGNRLLCVAAAAGESAPGAEGIRA